jgi:uncharacterized phage-associated protein
VNRETPKKSQFDAKANELIYGELSMLSRGLETQIKSRVMGGYFYKSGYNENKERTAMPDIIHPDAAANFLLHESRERGEVLTNLKLQKLLYYSQAWFLALHDRELFSEDFQAWVHGPVLPSQYKRFKEHQWRPLVVEIDRPKIGKIGTDHLSEIIDVFGSESAVSLELMTHRERPWLDARGSIPNDRPSTAVITKSSMKSFYKAMSEN